MKGNSMECCSNDRCPRCNNKDFVRVFKLNSAEILCFKCNYRGSINPNETLFSKIYNNFRRALVEGDVDETTRGMD